MIGSASIGETHHFVCGRCGSGHPLGTTLWRCSCGAPFDLSPPQRFDRRALAGRPFGPWRYREALPPVHPADIVTLGEGLTPLVDDAHRPGVKYKLDFLMPTGSFKDRGTTVLMTELKRRRAVRVVEDSSGNAGASVAAYARAAGIACDIYVPAGTSPNKTKQIRMYGARLIPVAGGRADVAAAAELAVGPGIEYATHTWSPFFLAGTATVAYELWEQLGARAPDNVIVPSGAGTLVLGAHLGFTQLIRAGAIERMPRLFAVQALNCAPLYHAWRTAEASIDNAAPVPASHTIAEGIRIERPVRGGQILSAVRDSGGAVLAVGEREIERAWTMLRGAGLLVEPTSAVVGAAVDALSESGALRSNETTVAVLTGTGLKAIDGIDCAA